MGRSWPTVNHNLSICGIQAKMKHPGEHSGILGLILSVPKL